MKMKSWTDGACSNNWSSSQFVHYTGLDCWCLKWMIENETGTMNDKIRCRCAQRITSARQAEDWNSLQDNMLWQCSSHWPASSPISNMRIVALHWEMSVFESLWGIMLEDSFDKVRVNAVEALFHLSSNFAEETVKHFASLPTLLDSLAKAVSCHKNAEVCNFAARTLCVEWVSTEIHYPAEVHRAW